MLRKLDSIVSDYLLSLHFKSHIRLCLLFYVFFPLVVHKSTKSLLNKKETVSVVDVQYVSNDRFSVALVREKIFPLFQASCRFDIIKTSKVIGKDSLRLCL